MGLKVIAVEPTPNPNALKFVVDGTIAARPASFFGTKAAEGHPVASKLFQVTGVSSVLLLNDFVTVNKSPEASWGPIRTKVKRILSES